jgi:hypothetical protein
MDVTKRSSKPAYVPAQKLWHRRQAAGGKDHIAYTLPTLFLHCSP